MIVLPILNRGRVLNVKVELKNVNKIAKGINTFNIASSDIVINNNRYSESFHSKDIATCKSVMNFIRSNSKASRSSILVSTKADEFGNYDIYEIKLSDEKVSDGIDNLIGTLILDLKNEKSNQKGRYLDLFKLGVFDLITEDKLNSLEYAKDNMERLNISKYIDDNNLRSLFKLVNCMDDFNFTVIKKSVMKEENFLELINFLEPTNSKDYNSLINYYDLAKSNQNEYSKLSYLYKTVNNKPLDLIHTPHEKVKVYTDEHFDEVA